MACLLLLDFILYIVYMLLVVFYLWLLGLLQSLLIWTFSQKQVGIAKPNRLRKQTLYDDSNEELLLTPPFENKTEPYEPDQEKLETPYLLQLEGHEQTFQCFAVRYLTEEFIQVDPLQLDAVQGLYVDVDGTPEEIEEQDRLENVQFNSLTESDIDDDEIHQQVLSNDIRVLSDTSTQNGHQDDRAQTLSEQLRIGTISIQQCPSTSMEHTGQSEYRNSSGADDNMSSSNYNSEDSRGVLDDHIAETEPPNVEPVRPTTQTGCLETNGAFRMQHEPQVHQNVMVDDIPFQPTDAEDTESTVSNLTPYDITPTPLMSMSTRSGTHSSNFSSILSEDSEAFAYEWIRLRTFSDWPLTSTFSTTLARNGWVSLGEGDRARCYICNVVHEGWRIGDDPYQYHSPNCRFKDGQSNNVPIFAANSHPTPTLGQVSLLSTQGDGSSGNNPDPVQGELQPGLNRPQQDSLSKETTSLSQETEEISSVVNNGNQNLIPNQQPTTPNRNLIRLDVDRPKYRSYAILAARISSFTSRPTAMTQTPRDMALAGFFYTGYRDYTKCFFCGGGLRNWEAGDDPWVEHVRFFPQCGFVRQKGHNFISLAQKRSAELEKQQEMVNPQRNTPVNTDPPTLERQANEKSLPSQNSDELTSLKQENSSLKDQILCKICMEKNASIVFLPCGHLTCCKDCAPAMRKCPICRKFVKGTVTTFLV